MDLESAVFCAVDIETTGVNVKNDEIISLACIPIVEQKILVGKIFYSLVKPRQYNHRAMKYHGISEDNLKDAPMFEDIADFLLEHLDGILVGHTTEFDYSFLRSNFKRAGAKFKKECVDIAMIERWLLKKRRSDDQDLTLDGMIASYGLKQHYRHNAIADAFFAAQIFQLQLREMISYGIDSPKKVVKASKSGRPSSYDHLLYG